MPSRASALLAALLELAAPTRCAGCELPGALVCDRCLSAMPRIVAGHACPRCAAPRSLTGECPECVGREYAFALARAYGSLAPPLSRLVSVYKDGGEERLTAPLAGMLVEAAGEWLEWADVLVPLPASPAGRRRRGRDHMHDIATMVASASGQVVADLIVRRRGVDQRGLGRQGRQANQLQAFALRDAGPIPARILLADDVFTTGASASAAARLLLDAGAHEVRFAAIARTHAMKGEGIS